MSKAQSVAFLLARLILGLILMAHATDNFFHGHARFTSQIHSLGLPAWAGYISLAVEFAAGIMVVIGFKTRLAAWGVILHMVPGVWVHGKTGFLYAADFPLAMIAVALVLAATGAGKYSVDG